MVVPHGLPGRGRVPAGRGRGRVRAGRRLRVVPRGRPGRRGGGRRPVHVRHRFRHRHADRSRRAAGGRRRARRGQVQERGRPHVGHDEHARKVLQRVRVLRPSAARARRVRRRPGRRVRVVPAVLVLERDPGRRRGRRTSSGDRPGQRGARRLSRGRRTGVPGRRTRAAGAPQVGRPARAVVQRQGRRRGDIVR